MRTKLALGALVIAMLLLYSFAPGAVSAGNKDQASIVAAEISVIANQLSLRPETAIDFTGVSGEYCFNVGMGEGGHMTHYAVDPMNTQEDVVDFVNATAFTEAGMSLKNLPPFPGGLGSMKLNTWYYLPAGELEPHHGRKFPFPLLVRASNIK
jgi:hypothetical protein